MRQRSAFRRTSLPPSDPPTKLRLPRMDFCVGCYCATCDIALLDLGGENYAAEVWRRHWERVIAARDLFLRSETSWVCRWQLRQLTDANGGVSLRGLRAMLDVADARRPTRLTAPTRADELQLEGGSN